MTSTDHDNFLDLFFVAVLIIVGCLVGCITLSVSMCVI